MRKRFSVSARLAESCASWEWSWVCFGKEGRRYYYQCLFFLVRIGRRILHHTHQTRPYNTSDVGGDWILRTSCLALTALPDIAID